MATSTRRSSIRPSLPDPKPAAPVPVKQAGAPAASDRVTARPTPGGDATTLTRVSEFDAIAQNDADSLLQCAIFSLGVCYSDSANAYNPLSIFAKAVISSRRVHRSKSRATIKVQLEG